MHCRSCCTHHSQSICLCLLLLPLSPSLPQRPTTPPRSTLKGVKEEESVTGGGGGGVVCSGSCVCDCSTTRPAASAAPPAAAVLLALQSSQPVLHNTQTFSRQAINTTTCFPHTTSGQSSATVGPASPHYGGWRQGKARQCCSAWSLSPRCDRNWVRPALSHHITCRLSTVVLLLLSNTVTKRGHST